MKPSNPKDSNGIKKVPSSVVPRNVVMEIGLGMMEGALKYGRHNYRDVGVRASVYFDALNRHMDAWWEGEDIDPDSGLSHVTKALTTLVVLRDAMMAGMLEDDRPPRTNDTEWLNDLNSKAGALLKKYPDPAPAAVYDPASERGMEDFKRLAVVMHNKREGTEEAAVPLRELRKMIG